MPFMFMKISMNIINKSMMLRSLLVIVLFHCALSIDCPRQQYQFNGTCLNCMPNCHRCVDGVSCDFCRGG
jgi:hypothetical protein